jgi:type II secretory pathway pseudopilin PulG
MMRSPFAQARSRQRGATLIMSLVMIVLLSLIVISAFNLSTSNLKSVGNMQSREESLAAANSAIEQTVSGNFYNASTNQTINIDIDKDGTNDYAVTVYPPTCIGTVLAEEGAPSDPDLPSSDGWWFVDWDIKATVTDSVSGASLAVRTGVRAFMSDYDKTAKCV